MYRIRHLAIATALTFVSATAGFGQPIPAPPAIPAPPVMPAMPMPAGVMPADSVPVEAKKVPTLHNGLPLVPAPGDDVLRQLLIARYNAALGELKSVTAAYEHGISGFNFEALFLSAKRVHDAGMELSEKPADQILMLEKNLESTKQFEAGVRGLHEPNARGGESDKMHHATYLRLGAEIELLRAKRKAGLAK